MKLISRILLVNIAITFGIALLFAFSSGSLNNGAFLISLGLTGLGMGIFNLFVALIVFLTGQENRDWAKGFLLSGGVLFLLGFAVCTGSFGKL